MDLRAQKRRSFLSQPQGASTASLQRSLTQHSGLGHPASSPSRVSNNYHSNASFSSPSSAAERTSPSKQTKIELKLVCVGDGGCGKTSLLTRYVKGDYSNTYVPTVFDNEIISVQSGGYDVSLALWDTAGQEEYDRLRALSYPESDVLLLCYSLDSPASLENISDKWLPEVRTYCPGIPILLVGLKSDCRKEGEVVLKWTDGQQIAQEEGLAAFLECSALMNYNVNTVFEVALSTVLPQLPTDSSAKTGPALQPKPDPKPDPKPEQVKEQTKPKAKPKPTQTTNQATGTNKDAASKPSPPKPTRKRDKFHCTIC